jgi:hypothetical protein
VKLRHRDAVRQALMNRLGLRGEEADFMIRIAEREYGFAEPPAGEAPEVTLRLLATMEYVKETLAELDAEAAMLPGGRNHDSRARAVGSPRLLTPPITGSRRQVRPPHLLSRG